MKKAITNIFKKNVPEYIDEINEAVKKFWNFDELEVIFENEKRTIKSYRDVDSNNFFILDKKEDNINVYNYSDEYGEIRKSIKEYNIFNYIKKNAENNLHLFLPPVIENDGVLRKHEYELEYMSIDELEKGREDVIKNNFGEDVLSLFDKELEERRKNNGEEKRFYLITVDVDVLCDFSKVLIDKGLFNKKYDRNYYDMIEHLASLKHYSYDIQKWGALIENIIKIANQKNYKTKEDGFWFNDADNLIYSLSDNELVFRHQEYAEYMIIKDFNNYTIYKSNLKDMNNIRSVANDDENIILAVLDGKIIKSKYIMLSNMDICLKFANMEIEDVKNIKKKLI